MAPAFRGDPPENGRRMPSTADELAAASHTDFVRASASRRCGLLLSNFAAIAMIRLCSSDADVACRRHRSPGAPQRGAPAGLPR
jgi:hypothetical protein